MALIGAITTGITLTIIILGETTPTTAIAAHIITVVITLTTMGVIMVTTPIMEITTLITTADMATTLTTQAIIPEITHDTAEEIVIM